MHASRVARDGASLRRPGRSGSGPKRPCDGSHLASAAASSSVRRACDEGGTFPEALNASRVAFSMSCSLEFKPCAIIAATCDSHSSKCLNCVHLARGHRVTRHGATDCDAGGNSVHASAGEAAMADDVASSLAGGAEASFTSAAAAVVAGRPAGAAAAAAASSSSSFADAPATSPAAVAAVVGGGVAATVSAGATVSFNAAVDVAGTSVVVVGASVVVVVVVVLIDVQQADEGSFRGVAAIREGPADDGIASLRGRVGRGVVAPAVVHRRGECGGGVGCAEGACARFVELPPRQLHRGASEQLGAMEPDRDAARAAVVPERSHERHGGQRDALCELQAREALGERGRGIGRCRTEYGGGAVGMCGRGIGCCRTGHRGGVVEGCRERGQQRAWGCGVSGFVERSHTVEAVRASARAGDRAIVLLAATATLGVAVSRGSRNRKGDRRRRRVFGRRRSGVAGGAHVLVQQLRDEALQRGAVEVGPWYGLVARGDGILPPLRSVGGE
mmetsp:Transcript_48043/g.148261  ORF Transcript_48043/g.148261 Transcript_48043/m.148261 type:complete len:503 (-) Transcript_48043:265-1773(-)